MNRKDVDEYRARMGVPHARARQILDFASHAVGRSSARPPAHSRVPSETDLEPDDDAEEEDDDNDDGE